LIERRNHKKLFKNVDVTTVRAQSITALYEHIIATEGRLNLYSIELEPNKGDDDKCAAFEDLL
jgi:hypothetical protein